jgi:hypothetical protein
MRTLGIVQIAEREQLQPAANFRHPVMNVDCAQQFPESGGFDDGRAMTDGRGDQCTAQGPCRIVGRTPCRDGEAESRADDRTYAAGGFQPVSRLDTTKHLQDLGRSIAVIWPRAKCGLCEAE